LAVELSRAIRQREGNATLEGGACRDTAHVEPEPNQRLSYFGTNPREYYPRAKQLDRLGGTQ
jgi:hypothetical protein